ncbi:AAA family ATPase [Cedecea davisae]|uniref:AAA family ATPase n=1 Tax=Cedecea davisae TaxID=158484 RepID=UPI001D0B0DA5|nr:AAA family ATPase [Cedecea davisae]
MSKQEIVLTSESDYHLTHAPDNNIYLKINTYKEISIGELDQTNSILKLEAEIEWSNEITNYELIKKYESKHKNITSIALIGSEGNLTKISENIRNGKLRIKIPQLKSLYNVHFFSQIYDEETYRWLLTTHEEKYLDFLKKIKDLAASTNIFNNLKNNKIASKYEPYKILIDNSTTNFAYEKGYKVILSSLDSPIYHMERTEKLYLPSTNELIPIVFSNELNIQNPIHVIIGKNGSGKSYHLKEYIKSYFKDFDYSSYNPDAIFSRIVLVSNTVDDKDYTPSKICRDKSKRSNYHFISNTSLKHFNNIYTQGNKITLNACIEDIIFREITRTGGFNKAVIADEILDVLNLNIEFSITAPHSANIVHSVENALNFFRNSYMHYTLNLGDINIELLFRSGEEKTALSSGQNTFLVKALSILTTIETNSLVIIEEPENFLHPSLLIKFMTILKKILITTNSCAIISTHSPLVLRELPKEQVTIFNRYNNITSHRTPMIETFGADTTQLYQESFSELETNASYRETIYKIAKAESSVDELLSKYSHLPTPLLTKIINEWRRK